VPLIPLFPLDLVLFPGIPLPLHIFEPRYKEMIGECLEQKSPFGMVRVQESAIAEVGCTAEILKVVKRYPDGRFDILTQGKRRFEVVTLDQERPFLRGEVLFVDDEPSSPTAESQDRVRELHEEMMELLGGDREVSASDDVQLSYRLAAAIPTDLDFKQMLLGIRSEGERVRLLIEYYEAVIPKITQTMEARRKAGRNGHVR
jgi:Lon protease-like protein